MLRRRRFFWLSACVALAVACAVAGSVWGDTPAGVGPLVEPTASLPTPSVPAHIYFYPPNMPMTVGQEAWLEVRIDNAQYLTSLMVRAYYDGSLMEIVHENGVPLMVPGDLPTPGDYNFSDYTYMDMFRVYSRQAGAGEPMASGNGVFYRIRVRALAPGVAPLTFRDVLVRGPVHLPYALTDGSITISAPPGSRMIHGFVLDAAGAPVPNAQLTLSRDNNGTWTQSAAGTSGTDGVFRLFTNPIPGTYKLVMQPPTGYTGSSAALPDGVTGEVVSEDTLSFALDDSSDHVGPFEYVVATGPTPVPTLPPVVLSGHVTMEGQPLAGVEVTLAAGELSSVQTTTTDIEGYYAFAATPGVYTLSIHDPEGRIPDLDREIDTDALEPGPINWGNWRDWLPLVLVEKE